MTPGNQQDYIDYRLQKADESFEDAILIDKEIGKLFSQLFDLRQKGDYGDMYDYDAEIAEPLIPKTKEFIVEIRRLIASI